MNRKILSLFILVIGILITFFSISNRKHDYIKKLQEEEYFGTIDTIFMDPEARMQPKAILTNGDRIPINNPIYSKILSGDLLLKRKNDVKFFIIRKNDTTIFYQKYDGEEIREQDTI